MRPSRPSRPSGDDRRHSNQDRRRSSQDRRYGGNDQRYGSNSGNSGSNSGGNSGSGYGPNDNRYPADDRRYSADERRQAPQDRRRSDDRRQDFRRPGNFDRRNQRRGRDGGSQRGGDRGRSKQPDYRALLTDLQQRTSIDPFERIKLETRPEIHTTRAMELVSPIGKGQRCLIVSPPKAGKTTMLQDVARAVEENHPEILVMVLLVDERPEEVTGFRRAVKSEVFAASSDMSAQDHVALAERCLARALEPVIAGKDVMILLDSITRLARAYNTVSEGVGRTMSGGLDAATMHAPRQIFGAARKIEEGGSLTILGTALVETGSRMDDIIFQEFKGTGNTEIVLSRALFEKRIFPAVDITQSGTRKQEKLYPPETMKQLNTLQRALAGMEKSMAMKKLLDLLERYPTNAEALAAIGAALAPEKAV